MENKEGFRGQQQDWNIRSTGFLEKRNFVGVWNYCWVVLENSKLYLYDDETERKLKNKIPITPTTIIEASQADGNRSFIFHISDPMNKDSQHLLFASPDFSSLETWMIAIIQTVNGSYRQSENFCSGSSFTSSADTRSSLILPSLRGMSIRFSRSIDHKDPEKFGFLLKQGSEFKTWKRRWFHLKHNHLRYFEQERDEGLKGFRFIDDESKVIMLPIGFNGQSYGFSLITLDSMSGQCSSLRMSASSEDEMYSWISALRTAIRRYTEDQYSIPLTTEQEEERETRESEDEKEEEIKRFLSGDDKLRGRTLSVSYVDCPLIRVIPEESLEAIVSEPEPPRAFFLNDNTVWAKLNRKFSSQLHSPQNDDLQRLYLLHFCALIPGSNYILVEVFEHQRYLPLKGWSCLHLLFTDCSKLSNCIGVKYPDRYLRRADPPLDYSWVEERSISEDDGINLLDYGILTPWKWTACRAFTVHGERAWCYGTSFEDIRRKYEDPELRDQSHTVQRSIDVVRRRRWIRLAVENTQPL